VAIGSLTSLLAGHGFDDTNVTIPAGEALQSPEVAGLPSRNANTVRGIRVECPMGDVDCELEFAEDGTIIWVGAEPMVTTNQMILAANSGPRVNSDDENPRVSSDGEHATNLITRITETNQPVVGSTRRPGTNEGTQQGGSTLVRSTLADEPPVQPRMQWSHEDGSPTFAVDMGRAAFGTLPGTPATVMVNTRIESNVPNLRDGWNGAILRRNEPGGTSMFVVVHSNIEQDEVETRQEIDPAFPQRNVRHMPGTGNDRYDFSNPRDPDGRQPNTQPAAISNLEPTGVQGERLRFTLPIDPGERSRLGLRDGESDEIFVELRTDPADLSIPFAVDFATPVRLFAINNDGSTRTLGRELDDVGMAELVCAGRTGADNTCELVQINPDTGSLRGAWRLSLNGVTRPVERTNTDLQYLTLGTWLSLPDTSDGRIDVGSFAHGSAPFLADRLAALEGTAQYMGSATGIYVEGAFDTDPTNPAGRESAVRDARVGSFVARARLDADFDTNEVGGRVDDFRENGELLGDWNLGLDTTALSDLSGTNGGNISGEADGRPFRGGNWNLQFYQDGNEQDRIDAGGPDRPGYAAGTFSANTHDPDESVPLPLGALHIVGAFGADLQ